MNTARHEPVEIVPLAKPASDIRAGNLDTLRRKARTCRACPLWRNAKQTVFGEGPERASIMMIGEQPGLQEDIAGKPFVGPAGQLLDRAMEEAGLDRDSVYLTNAVKHFKYETRGTAKLHKRANASEQAACRQWLAAELLRVSPRLIIGLGAMAAQTMFGNDFRITGERGRWKRLGDDVRGLATWHPSAVLRMPREERRHEAFAELVADLRKVAGALADLEES
jgi:uracil-DNA glycosylase family protein